MRGNFHGLCFEDQLLMATWGVELNLVGHNGNDKNMKNSIILMLLLVISKVVYADISFTEQEIPKVTANNGYEFTVPYFELETPFGITAYKVKLVAPTGQLTFSVDLSTLEAIPLKQRTDNSNNQLPIPTFSVTGLSFDATGSHDPDGSISKYEWLVNNQIILSTTTPVISDNYYCSVFLTSGYYLVKLIVTDNQATQNALEQNVYIERPGKPNCFFSDSEVCLKPSCRRLE